MRAEFVDGTSRLVEGLVASVAAQYSIAWPQKETIPLVDKGFTSMAIVELMLAIEREFDLTIPDTDLAPENFSHVESLVALVKRLTGQSGELSPAKCDSFGTLQN